MMKFEYEIKGVALTMDDMVEINQYYQIAKIAEYLMENYNLDYDKAMNFGYNVRLLMDKYDYTEEEAIDEVMEEKDYDED